MKDSSFRSRGDRRVHVIDSPVVYSITPYSEIYGVLDCEEVTIIHPRDFVFDKDGSMLHAVTFRLLDGGKYQTDIITAGEIQQAFPEAVVPVFVTGEGNVLKRTGIQLDRTVLMQWYLHDEEQGYCDNEDMEDHRPFGSEMSLSLYSIDEVGERDDDWYTDELNGAAQENADGETRSATSSTCSQSSSSVSTTMTTKPGDSFSLIQACELGLLNLDQSDTGVNPESSVTPSMQTTEQTALVEPSGNPSTTGSIEDANTTSSTLSSSRSSTRTSGEYTVRDDAEPLPDTEGSLSDSHIETRDGSDSLSVNPYGNPIPLAIPETASSKRSSAQHHSLSVHPSDGRTIISLQRCLPLSPADTIHAEHTTQFVPPHMYKLYKDISEKWLRLELGRLEQAGCPARGAVRQMLRRRSRGYFWYMMQQYRRSSQASTPRPSPVVVKDEARSEDEHANFAGTRDNIETVDPIKSGDGSLEHVGIKVGGQFQCPDCRQKFDTEKTKLIHWRFFHDPDRHQDECHWYRTSSTSTSSHTHTSGPRQAEEDEHHQGVRHQQDDPSQQWRFTWCHPCWPFSRVTHKTTLVGEIPKTKVIRCRRR